MNIFYFLNRSCVSKVSFFSRSNVYSVAKYKINALANRASERPTQVQDQNRQQLKKRANSSAGRTKRVVVFSHHVLSLAVDRMLCRHDVAYNSQITFLVSLFQWSPFDKHVANVWASDYQQLAFVLWLFQDSVKTHLKANILTVANLCFDRQRISISLHLCSVFFKVPPLATWLYVVKKPLSLYDAYFMRDIFTPLNTGGL